MVLVRFNYLSDKVQNDMIIFLTKEQGGAMEDSLHIYSC
jgi:hypothetical protein